MELRPHDRQARWDELQAIVRRLTDNNLGVMREAMTALAEIRDEKLFVEGSYATFKECLLEHFSLPTNICQRMVGVVNSLPVLETEEPESDDGPAEDEGDDEAEEDGEERPPPRTRRKKAPVAKAKDSESPIFRGQAAFADLRRAVKKFENDVKNLKMHPLGKWLNVDEVNVHLHNAAAAIKDAMPAGICGYCHEGDPCRKCFERRWLPLSLYKHMPITMRREI